MTTRFGVAVGYLLDTDSGIEFLNGSSESVVEHLDRKTCHRLGKSPFRCVEFQDRGAGRVILEARMTNRARRLTDLSRTMDLWTESDFENGQDSASSLSTSQLHTPVVKGENRSKSVS